MNIEKTTTNQLCNGHLPLTEQKAINEYLQARQTPTMKQSLVQDIVQVLEQGMLILGIKGQNLPSPIEMQMLVTELKKEYSGLKLGELLLGFQLASRGKLDYQAETYQMFSVLYLNRMVSAYHRWAILQRQNIKEEEPNINPTSIPYAMPDQEIIDFAYETYLKHRSWELILMWQKAFHILFWVRKVINFDPELVVDNTIAALRSGVTNRVQKKEVEQIIEDEDKLEYLCKRMAVFMYFESLKK